MFDNFKPSKITDKQCVDTGMAITLILLLVFIANHNKKVILPAIIVLVITMSIPFALKYCATIWFIATHLIGTVMSKIILTLIFFTIVTPVGLFRRLLGFDNLSLKKWNLKVDSNLTIREHKYTKEDLKHPF